MHCCDLVSGMRWIYIFSHIGAALVLYVRAHVRVCLCHCVYVCVCVTNNMSGVLMVNILCVSGSTGSYSSPLVSKKAVVGPGLQVGRTVHGHWR